MAQNNFVILMMGYTCVGKSTTATKLSELMNTDISHSAVTRKDLGLELKDKDNADDFFDITSPARLEMDKAVYGENCKRAVASLKNGKNVIMDAGHFFVWQREQIYNSLKEMNPETYIINVVCDEEIVKKRMVERYEKFSDHILNETPSMHVYESTKIGTESPRGTDKLPDGSQPLIIEYDSHNKTTKIVQNNETYHPQKIIDALDKI